MDWATFWAIFYTETSGHPVNDFFLPEYGAALDTFGWSPSRICGKKEKELEISDDVNNINIMRTNSNFHVSACPASNRCYDHNFRRKKLAFYLKTNVTIQIYYVNTVLFNSMYNNANDLHILCQFFTTALLCFPINGFEPVTCSRSDTIPQRPFASLLLDEATYFI
jgi:hypothetical protein